MDLCNVKRHTNMLPLYSNEEVPVRRTRWSIACLAISISCFVGSMILGPLLLTMSDDVSLGLIMVGGVAPMSVLGIIASTRAYRRE